MPDYPFSKADCYLQGHTSSFMKSTPTCPLCGMTEWEQTCGDQKRPREFTVEMLATIRRMREESDKEESANNGQFGVGA